MQPQLHVMCDTLCQIFPAWHKCCDFERAWSRNGSGERCENEQKPRRLAAIAERETFSWIRPHFVCSLRDPWAANHEEEEAETEIRRTLAEWLCRSKHETWSFYSESLAGRSADLSQVFNNDFLFGQVGKKHLKVKRFHRGQHLTRLLLPKMCTCLDV